MPPIVDLLRREHGYMASVLDVLQRQLDRFEAGGQPDYEIIAGAVQYFQGFPDRCHHPKEDLILARLRKRDPAAAEAVGDLERAHLELARNLQTLGDAVLAVLGDAEVPRDAFAGLIRAFSDHQRQHFAMEEASFFPAIARVLTTDDWDVLKTALTEERDPLFGGHGDRRFELIRRTILDWQAEAEAGVVA